MRQLEGEVPKKEVRGEDQRSQVQSGVQVPGGPGGLEGRRERGRGPGLQGLPGCSAASNECYTSRLTHYSSPITHQDSTCRHLRLDYRSPMEYLVNEGFAPRTLAETGVKSGSATRAQALSLLSQVPSNKFPRAQGFLRKPVALIPPPFGVPYASNQGLPPTAQEPLMPCQLPNS